MEWLALGADVHRLQRVKSHLHALLLLWLRCWLASSHAHLPKLLRHALDTCWWHARLRRSRVARSWSLIPALSAILWLSIWYLLGCRAAHSWVAVRRLLWHAISGLRSLPWVAIPSLNILWCLRRYWLLARVWSSPRWCSCCISASSKLVSLASISVALLFGCGTRCRLLVVCSTILRVR